MKIGSGSVLFNQAWIRLRNIRPVWWIHQHMFWLWVRHLYFQWIANLLFYLAIDPKNKLSYYREQSQEKYDIAKAMFIEAVSYNYYFL
jgi:hypothetical protein